MKVCTDACILGAWTAEKIGGTTIKNILDIGTGTGVLSLMLAQRSVAMIDALEINREAALQASENIAASPWAKNINVIHASLHDFKPATTYALIISNPPFYEDDLQSADENKNAAHHGTTLKLAALIMFVNDHLEINGLFSLLIPYRRLEYLETFAAAAGLYVQKKLLIRQSPTHEYFRAVLLLSKNKPEITHTNELIIHDAERNYTTAFSSLLKDYYLKL